MRKNKVNTISRHRTDRPGSYSLGVAVCIIPALAVITAFIFSIVFPISVEAGFGNFLNKIKRDVNLGGASGSSTQSTTPKKPQSDDDKVALNMLRAIVEDKPERTNVEDEVGYGDTITAKMIQFYGGKLLDINQYPGVWKYCNLIVQALGRTNIMRPKLSVDSTYTSDRIENANEEDKTLFENIGYHVGIVENDDIGAVSAPGGYILLTTGLLKSCRCEAELAGVLAHEMAHISRNHGLYIMRKQMKKRMPIAFLSAGADGNMLSAAVGALDSYVQGFAYGRNEEFEADRYGAQIMYRTGYNPYAFTEFVASLKSGNSKAYKSHPSSKDRANRLNEYVKANLPGAEELPILQKRYDSEVRQKIK
jgi:hypothetical protein